MVANGSRRFTILDGMALVAASAVALWALRRFSTFSSVMPPKEPWGRLSQVVGYFGLSWTFAVFLLGLVGSREGRRERTGDAGFAACLAVSALAAWQMTETILSLAIAYARFGADPSLHVSNFVLSIARDYALASRDAGLVVALAWLVLAAGGRWEGGRSWTGRAGRLLGVGWIAATVAYHIACWLD